ncbi:MAG TPA: M48 family metallopeptidase [Candidatus Tectomicrobia bacterium]|nr:M48 family metallopeptidase [Candidatus Tectomicrobia bacterium]
MRWSERVPIRVLVAAILAATLSGCAGVVTSPGSASPRAEAPQAPPRTGRAVDPRHAERLQRVMVPLIQAMDNPRPLDQVRVGVIDDDSINAANAGGGQFYVTRGLLEKANDRHLAGVLAHEVAHDDLNHVAKAQVLNVGLNIGAAILEQIFPGTGAIAPVAGQLVARGYSRNEEYAADRHGVQILQRAGLPGEIMAETLTWLTKTSGGGGGGGFFSTHPATGDRIEALRNAR